MKILRSFNAKISAVFLVILIALSMAYISIAFSMALRLFDETEQVLNAGYAGSIAAELHPLVSRGLQSPALGQAIHYMMVLNPKVEIYILDPAGRVLAYFSDSRAPLQEASVNLGPVAEYLHNGAGRLILGQDPRAAGLMRPFSAAPLTLADGSRGYVYVILGGVRFQSALGMLAQSFFARAAGAAVLLIFLFAGSAGLVLFGLLTRRITRLSDAVRAFEGGDFSRRVPIRSSDEVDRLALSFNRLADRILTDMDRLRSVDRTRRELAANVSHDLRSPLASIRGYLETALMRADSLSRTELKDFLEVTLRNSITLQKLVDELFQLSMLENEGYRPRFERVRISELVQDVVLSRENQAGRKGISLSLRVPETSGYVSADIALVDRAVTNLLENAIAYTPRGGQVEVILEDRGDRIRIAVSDNGMGIGEKDIPFIFDRFYRVDKSRTKSEGLPGTGAGLGLAIARRIIELHGGRIFVDSRIGEGSMFSFELPTVT